MRGSFKRLGLELLELKLISKLLQIWLRDKLSMHIAIAL